MRYARLFLLFASVLAGCVMALARTGGASAGSEDVRWMSGVSTNWKVCFGVGDGGSGWHDTGGTAADLFADDIANCNDPNSSSDPVWAQTYGKSAVWGTYTLLGIT
jgi:hypothetical protein